MKQPGNTHHPEDQEKGKNNVISIFNSGRMDIIGVMTAAELADREWLYNLPHAQLKEIFAYLRNPNASTSQKIRIIENFIPQFSENDVIRNKISQGPEKPSIQEINEFITYIQDLGNNILVLLHESDNPLSINKDYVRRIRGLTGVGKFNDLESFSGSLIRIFPEKYKHMSIEEMRKLYNIIYNYIGNPASKTLSANVSPGHITIMNNITTHTNTIINPSEDIINPDDTPKV